MIAAVLVVVASMSFLSNRLFSGMTQSVEKNQFDMMQSIIEFNLKGAEDRALARAEMLAQLPTLKRLFAAKDRAGLLAEYGPMFKEQKDKYGVDQMQFHSLPAVSFLRMQAPDLHGDDLTAFRPLVVAVNRDQVTRKGLSIAKTGPAIFGVVPVRDEAGTHIGSLEIGLHFGNVLDALKAAYGFELAVYIEEEPLRTLALGLSKDLLDEQNRVGKYLKYHATHWDLIKKLVSSRDIGGLTEPRRYTREALGLTYGILLVPIQNAAGVPIGVIAVAKNFQETRAAAGRSVVWQGLLGLFAITILAGVILMVVRGFLLRPLAAVTARFGDLAGGQHQARIEDVDGLSAELQGLASHHETLRNAAAAAAAPASGDDDDDGKDAAS